MAGFGTAIFASVAVTPFSSLNSVMKTPGVSVRCSISVFRKFCWSGPKYMAFCW